MDRKEDNRKPGNRHGRLSDVTNGSARPAEREEPAVRAWAARRRPRAPCSVQGPGKCRRTVCPRTDDCVTRDDNGKEKFTKIRRTAGTPPATYKASARIGGRHRHAG